MLPLGRLLVACRVGACGCSCAIVTGHDYGRPTDDRAGRGQKQRKIRNGGTSHAYTLSAAPRASRQGVARWLAWMVSAGPCHRRRGLWIGARAPLLASSLPGKLSRHKR